MNSFKTDFENDYLLIGDAHHSDTELIIKNRLPRERYRFKKPASYVQSLNCEAAVIRPLSRGSLQPTVVRTFKL